MTGRIGCGTAGLVFSSAEMLHEDGKRMPLELACGGTLDPQARRDQAYLG